MARGKADAGQSLGHPPLAHALAVAVAIIMSSIDVQAALALSMHEVIRVSTRRIR